MISKILVANRGEIARRVFRTCRNMGIGTVAIYSDVDKTEPHVAEADVAVPLHGSTPAETYLNVDAILDAAKSSGADAIHPGYGFLSENPIFARAVIDNGLTWIGPSPEAIKAMGSKVGSKKIMEEAGVPVVPAVEITQGMSTTQSAALAVGFPLIVKASGGGGGKGMRIVQRLGDLAGAIEAGEREAFASFGDGTIFIESYLNAPRHIEVQVFGDTHGNIVSMFERECSIQRRHQKIIEEAPSPALDEETRARVSEVAVTAARAVDYVGAGTVEFLFHNNRFYFLEMNTRLQVEHPVTEMVTGLDLVELQIRVANGEEIDPRPRIEGHAIEARLYAEDPANDFLPTTGILGAFEFNVLEGLRVDSGVETGSEVSIHYDPMVAKVVAHARTREGAASLLARSLRGARIHGLTTNRSLLVHVLEHPEFLAGNTDTQFLDRHAHTDLTRPLVDADDEPIYAAVAAVADQALARSQARVMTSIPSGWRNSTTQQHRRSYVGEHGQHDVSYRINRNRVQVADLESVEFVEVSPDRVVIDTEEAAHLFTVARYGSDRYVDTDRGPARLTEVAKLGLDTDTEDDPGSLHAPMPGVVLRINVGLGDTVTGGQVLVVLEAMKMEHALRATHSGVVTAIHYNEGDQVEAGAVLIVIGDDP